MTSMLAFVALALTAFWGAEALAASERPRLLVMNLEAASGISEDDALTLTQLVTVEAEDLGTFRTLSYKDLQTMIALEGDRAALGCSDTSCLADLAGAIGARFVLYGRLSKLGSRIILQLNLIDSEAAKPLARKAIKAGTLGAISDRLGSIVGAVLAPAVTLIDPAAAKAQKIAREESKALAVKEAAVKEAPKQPERVASTEVVRPTSAEADALEEETALSVLAGDRPDLEGVRSVKKIDGVQALAGTEATFVVEGSPQEVMRALWQPTLLHEILPGGKSTVVKRQGKGKKGRRWVEATLSDKIILMKVAYTVRLMRDDRRGVLSFQEISGDVDAVRGRFTLRRAHEPGYTVVTYRIFFDVGMMVPSIWARRAIREQPVEMAETLRARVRDAVDETKALARKAERKKAERKKAERKKAERKKTEAAAKKNSAAAKKKRKKKNRKRRKRRGRR